MIEASKVKDFDMGVHDFVVVMGFNKFGMNRK